MTTDKFGDEDTCVKVYNPHEPDVKKKLIVTYINYQKAGNALGILPRIVYRKCSDKQRIYAPSLKQEVALRLAKKDKV